MSETVPEARAPRNENVFTHRIGPLPMWAWVAIIGVALVVWRWYAQSHQSAAAAQQASAAGNPNTVPQFVNQTYTTVTAPQAPAAGPAPPGRPNPVPSPGGGGFGFLPPSLPPPVTISGAPGSYTTGLGGGKLDEWTSTGQYSLNVIAKSHGMTAQQLIQSSLAAQNNVPLQQYVKTGNYNAKVPAGVQLFFPAQYWNQPLRKVG